VYNVLLLDTNIVSHMGLKVPKPGLRPWLTEIGTARLAICYPVIAELLRGAHLLAPSNPDRAHEILNWVAEIQRTNFVVLQMNLEVADVYARMTSTPRLKYMWTSDGKSKRNRLGHDLMIAAVSIVHRTPIITGNIGDFLAIDQSFPLPGVYHPYENVWYVAPPFEVPLPLFDRARCDPETHLLPALH